jgi:hypothetical protein
MNSETTRASDIITGGFGVPAMTFHIIGTRANHGRVKWQIVPHAPGARDIQRQTTLFAQLEVIGLTNE